jgi:Predicted transcription factor, homolog of eukaryotic MBF1
MPQPKELDPYANPRAFYGAELRRLREAAGLSQNQLGERVFCSGSYIGQFESAMRRPQVDLSRVLDELLGSGEHLQRLSLLARQSKVADYFADAAELEQQARKISEYAPMLVPGVLQTRGYADALLRSARRASEEALQQQVSARLDRGKLLDCDTPPAFWAILHEAALQVPVGGAAIMAEQLTHLVDAARTHQHFIVQVMPFNAGAHPFLNTMVSLMSFTEGPSVVYTEGVYTGQLIDEPALVDDYRSTYDLARALALSPETSLAMIASTAKDYATYEQRL